MSETDAFVYIMAAEKMVGLLSNIEQTMEFLEEYKVKPDEEVKKCLIPMIKRMEKWVKNGK